MTQDKTFVFSCNVQNIVTNWLSFVNCSESLTRFAHCAICMSCYTYRLYLHADAYICAHYHNSTGDKIIICVRRTSVGTWNMKEGRRVTSASRCLLRWRSSQIAGRPYVQCIKKSSNFGFTNTSGRSGITAEPCIQPTTMFLSVEPWESLSTVFWSGICKTCHVQRSCRSYRLNWVR